LELLKSVNQAAMRRAQIDDEVMESHPYWESMRLQIEALKRTVQETNEQLNAANAERARLGGMLQEMQETIARIPFRAIVRRKLARGIVGKLYRASKRHARTVVSRIR